MQKPAKNGRTILVVDDQRMVLGAVRDILESQGYRVLTAGAPSEALRIGEEHDGPIDVLLTDVVMPGMNGRELADRFTEIRPETRVIYMSGHIEDQLVRQGVRLKEIAFVAKPFSLASLKSKLREVLGEGGPAAAQRVPAAVLA